MLYWQISTNTEKEGYLFIHFQFPDRVGSPVDVML